MNAVLLAMWSDMGTAAALAEAATRLAGDDPAGRARAAIASAYVGWFSGDRSAASHADIALALLDPDDPTAVWARVAYSWFRALSGSPEEAHTLCLEVAIEFKGPGDDHLYGAMESLAADFGAASGELDRSARESRESLEIARRLSCPSCESQALSSLVLVDPCDEMGGRVTVARQAIRLADGIGEVFNVLCGLDVLVGALGTAGAFQDLVRLASATTAVRRATGFGSVMPGRHRAAEDAVARARKELDTISFERMTALGGALDYDATLRFALGDALPEQGSLDVSR
jgi:hypothetical protein